MTDHPQLLSALQYAEIGWSVFPVGPDKRPLVATGFHAATTCPDQIKEWWGKWGSAGIGVACLKSGIFVIDLDRNHGNARDGVQAWEFAQQDFGDDNRGLMASTPSGGSHIVYIHPGQRITTTNNVIKDSGIDCRGDGGYFIVPSPSDPGREWAEGDPFEEEEEDGTSAITQAPQWVLDIVVACRGPSSSVGIDSGKAMKMSDGEVARIRSALSEIDNHDHDTWVMVGMALKSTFAKSQAYSLWSEWSSHNYGAFDERECRLRWQSFRELRLDGSEVTLGSMFHRAKESGWIDASGLPDEPYQPSEDASKLFEHIEKGKEKFPSELLNVPGLIGDLTHYIGHVNDDFPQPALGFGAAMAIVNGLMGSIVRTGDGRFNHLYIVGLGESGCGKDASKNAVSSLLTEIGCGGIVCSSDWTSDAALRRELSNQDTDTYTRFGRVAAIDEFGDWLSVANDGANTNKRQMRSLFMEVWGSSTDKVISGVAYADPKSRPSVSLTAPCLTIYGVSTPNKVYESLGARSNIDGLTNRLLFIRVDNDIPDSVSEEKRSMGKSRGAIINRLEDVASWLRPKGFVADSGGNWTPIVATYSKESTDRLTEISEEVKELRRKEATSGSQSDGAGLWVRAPETIRRVATVFACGEKTSEVTLRHVGMAELFVRWSINRTKSEMSLAGGDNDHEVLQRCLLKEIAKHPRKGATRSNLARAVRTSTAKQRSDALSHLIEAGDVEEVVSTGDGRPATTYRSRKN